MAKLSVTPEFSLEMEGFTAQTNDFYENWNEKFRAFLGNDAALKQLYDDNGLTVEDGKLCMTFERED